MISLQRRLLFVSAAFLAFLSADLRGERFSISGGGGGFYELYGGSNVYQGISNRTSYGMRYAIIGNRIRGTAHSTELTSRGEVVGRSLKIRGKVFSVRPSPPQNTGDVDLFYHPGYGYSIDPVIVPLTLKARLIFRLSDGTRFIAKIKGKYQSRVPRGYTCVYRGAFYKRGYRPQHFVINQNVHLYDRGQPVW